MLLCSVSSRMMQEKEGSSGGRLSSMSMSVVMGAGGLSVSDLHDFLAKEVLKITGQSAKELEVVLTEVNVGKTDSSTPPLLTPYPRGKAYLVKRTKVFNLLQQPYARGIVDILVPRDVSIHTYVTCFCGLSITLQQYQVRIFLRMVTFAIHTLTLRLRLLILGMRQLGCRGINRTAVI